MAHALQSPVHLFDYLSAEEASPRRHEYVAGSIHAMTGGTMRHNRITGNAFKLLSLRFDGTPCQVFINDMKLHVQAADSVYYPDVFVYCGSAIAGDQKLAQDAVLIVEVSSDSTVEIDRREKLAAYQKLPGIQAYWIVSQTEKQVELHARDATGRWQAMAYTGDDHLPVAGSADEPVPLAQLYAGTDLA
ncbi:Uma2 family endonuclease [Aquabacterium sp.]|uniref:Uma2 family endonuclease n=1 Tax=Aquabacterium sp. TaxID=1872578 RepID=UPI002BC31843|nr:Uma2 family endonuclease [Aquabacterium sp.]HSW04470.1 Uma2 family endonuclease [Aquabacterium sp.]